MLDKIKHSITFNGKIDNPEWEHFLWNCNINGQVFTYKTGLGHSTPVYKKGYSFAKRNKKPQDIKTIVYNSEMWVHVPTLESILNCLIMDAYCGEMSFSDFCDDFGYSNDSLKALDTYRACEENSRKIRAALGKDYLAVREYIESLEL